MDELNRQVGTKYTDSFQKIVKIISGKKIRNYFPKTGKRNNICVNFKLPKDIEEDFA